MFQNGIPVIRYHEEDAIAVFSSVQLHDVALFQLSVTSAMGAPWEIPPKREREVGQVLRIQIGVPVVKDWN